MVAFIWLFCCALCVLDLYFGVTFLTGQENHPTFSTYRLFWPWWGWGGSQKLPNLDLGWVKVCSEFGEVCGEFGEVTGIIDLVIKFFLRWHPVFGIHTPNWHISNYTLCIQICQDLFTKWYESQQINNIMEMVTRAKTQLSLILVEDQVEGKDKN